MRRFASSLFYLIACFHGPALAVAAGADSPPSPELNVSLPVEKFVLDNGLTVLLSEDHSIPMISYHTWYRVGSRNERMGVTGAAHMLEHMMFKGAKKYSDKQFDQILHANGIQNNAFTTNDYTGFYENLPSSKLELIMDVEVDRMRNLAINPESLKSELQVVGEERRWRVDNSPVSLLREAMLDQLFQVHPYHWPVIGYMKDIQAYTSDKLREFYQTYYVANNAVLVISGDFEPKATKELVQKYYGSLPRRELPASVRPSEPERTKAATVKKKSEVQNTTLMLAFKTVANGDRDQYALDLAANLLGVGTSSRLYKKLVYQMQEAIAAGAFSETQGDPGYFSVFASVKPGKKGALSEKTLWNVLEDLKKHKVSPRELEKSKNQVMKEFVDGLTTVDGRAQTLAVTEIQRGDYRTLFEDLKLYQAVTVEDIQRVSQKYFRRERSVTAVLEPGHSTPTAGSEQ